MKRKRYNKLNPMIKGLCFVLFLTFQWPWQAGAQDHNPDQMVWAGQPAGEYNRDSSDFVPLRQLIRTLENQRRISFLYTGDLVNNMMVHRSAMDSDNLAQEFGKILAEIGLTYEKHTQSTYLILEVSDNRSSGQNTSISSYQEIVSGRVTDSQSGEVLPGVNIVVKGTSAGTATDSDGLFELTVPSLNETLVFSYIGYQSLEYSLEGTSRLEIEMNPEALFGEELVVIGYGTQTRADLTGSVSTVNVERTLATRPITDLGRGLQGAVPGLTITTPTGELGTNPNITLRGMRGSLNTGSAGARPLILVDNVEISNLNMLNPNDIESISVLKDAASTAIYGTRAAWGAILITTKSGSFETSPQVTYTNNLSTATPTTNLQVAPAVPGTEMAFSAMQRTNPSTNVFTIVGMSYDETGIQKMREWEQQYGGQNLGPEMVMGRDFEVRDGRLFFYRPWDAADMYVEDWTPMQNHNLNVSGGSESINYDLGLGYTGQTGVLKVNPDQWDRYNVNLTLNSKVNDWLDVRWNIMWSRTDHQTPYNFYSATYDYWYYLYRWPATYPFGTYEGLPFRNPATEVSQANMNELTENMTRFTVGGTASLMEGWSVDVDFTYGTNNANNHIQGGSVSGYNFWAGGGNLNYGSYTAPANDRVRYATSWANRSNLRALTTYNADLQSHSFSLMAGTDMELFQSWSQYSERRDLLDQQKSELSLAVGDQFAGGGRGHWSTMGFFGRVNYSFQNKYLLQVNARVDGSSRFPSDDQWALFPSVSAGWVLTQESFMDFAKPALSFLKIRGSWGTIGNQNVGQNAFISTMGSLSSGWLVGSSSTQPTFGTPGPVSSSLTWEKVTTLDLGLDATLFRDRLSVTFDWYKRKTSDMLTAGITLPSSFGASAPRRNFGEMETEGWEIELTWNQVVSNDFQFYVTGTLTDFQERIVRFPDVTRTVPNTIAALNNVYYEGMVLGEIWGYETDGFFTADDFEQDAAGNLIRDDNGRYILKDGIPDQSLFESGWFFYGPGDIRYRDLDGDGEITYGEGTVDNPGDRRIIGNSTPRYQYGFTLGGNWKNIDFNIFLQGVGKRDFWANGPIFIPGYRPGEAWYTHQLDYWTPDNPNAFYPRPTDHSQSNNIRNFLPQTRYMLDLSYLRLKNVTIGYTLPTSLLERLPITAFRIYVSGENLFEFDNLGDMPIDPEMDYTTPGLNDTNSFGRVYPYRRTLSAGVSVSF
ncbi:MAG TPA: TonB-dependent receptor [Balneolaceae bacterium]|nr:TonB-dependent receptor [Balneolaceae bacterium]